MIIERSETIYDAATGETRTEARALALVLTPEPAPEEGYVFEEWLEETNGQLIQHWIRRPNEASISADEALEILLGE